MICIFQNLCYIIINGNYNIKHKDTCMNNWTMSKNLDIKKDALNDIIRYIPKCDNINNTICLMPSTTCLDIEALKNANLINSKTNMYAIDNLKSKDFFEHYDKESSFRKIIKKRLFDIFGDNRFYNKNKNNFIFQDVFKTILSLDVKHKCRFIYIDSCNSYSNYIIEKWFCDTCNIDAVCRNGIYAINFMINRNRDKIEGDDTELTHPCDFIFKGYYPNGEENYRNKMKIIGNKIEHCSKNALNVVSMIHYCESDYKSQMLVVICKKVK